MSLRLSVKAFQGLAQNFRAGEAISLAQSQRAVKRFNDRVVRDIKINCAYDTGRMSRLAEGRIGPSGLTAEQGWWPEPFEAEGEDAYYIIVELGGLNYPAQPSLYPAVVKATPSFEAEMADIARRATNRALRGGR